MKITVTQEHINEGQRQSPWRCPIALAIKAQGYAPKLSGVGSVCVWLKEGLADYQDRVELPDVATEFIESFDKGNPVHPFTFELALP